MTFKKKIIISTFIVLLLLFTFTCRVKDNDEDNNGQNEDQELVSELNQWLIPLQSSPLELSDDALNALEGVRDADIVALGEATHGTSEFFRMKHRIFKYLVENHGHRAIGFEADFGSCIYLNNYVMRGEGDLEELMKTRLHYWIWKTREVKELIQWMREYNTGKSEEEQIYFIGLDCLFRTYQIPLLREYLQRTVPSLLSDISPLLDEIEGLSDQDYEGMDETELNDLKARLESVRDLLSTEEALLTANSSHKEYQLYKQLVNVIRQAVTLKCYFSKKDYSISWRDRAMAENAQWLVDYVGPGGKITVWAHNAHIGRNPTFSATSSFEGGDGAMGYHLDQAVGERYLPLGFAFSMGQFTAVDVSTGESGDPTTLEITTEPQDFSFNHLLHQASQPNFIFHIDAVPGGSHWETWFESWHQFLMLGFNFTGNPADHYNAHDIRRHYDWIIYFDGTTASELL